MKRIFEMPLLAGAIALVVLPSVASAVVIVNDRWADGTRSDPAAPVYSEVGVDSDLDTDLESAWYIGKGSTAAASLVASPGHLTMTQDPSASSSMTTYFVPEAAPVSLLAPGDKIKVTWAFTTGNVNASNTSQNFRLALVNSPAASRISTDTTPASDAYTGYALFGNMGETTGHNSSFNLKKRSSASGALLSGSSDWGTSLANGLGNGAVGYADNTSYTFTLEATRNAASGLDLVMTMVGGNIGGTGSIIASATDASPASFDFDTFALRPSSGGGTADVFDTTLFRVDVTLVPEPTSLGVAALGLSMVRRRR